MKHTRGENAFNVFNMFILAILSIICLYPLWHVLCASFSDPLLLKKHLGGFLIPDGFTFGGYVRVFRNPNIVSGFFNSLYYVVTTTVIGVFLTSMAAYALSRKGPALTGLCMKLIMVTWFFGGGIIPFYIQMKNMHLMDTRWAIILPSLVATWNLIIMRTSFQGMPVSLEESARLDGANDFTIYWKIMMPLGLAVNAVMILLIAVNMWNSWFNASMFILSPKKKPLQLILRDILIKNDMNSVAQGDQGYSSAQGQEADKLLVKYCTIIVATVPILCVYPFLQKYFVHGVMVGSLKG